MCERYLDSSNINHCVFYYPCEDLIITNCPIKAIGRSSPCVRYKCPKNYSLLASSSNGNGSSLSSSSLELVKNLTLKTFEGPSDGSNVGRDIGFALAGIFALIIIILVAVLCFKKPLKSFLFRLRRMLFVTLLCASLSLRREPEHANGQQTLTNDPSAPEQPPSYSTIFPNEGLSINPEIRLSVLEMNENQTVLNETVLEDDLSNAILNLELNETSDISDLESRVDQVLNSTEIEAENQSVYLIDLNESLNHENETDLDSVLINLNLNEPEQDDLFPDLSELSNRLSRLEI